MTQAVMSISRNYGNYCINFLYVSRGPQPQVLAILTTPTIDGIEGD